MRIRSFSENAPVLLEYTVSRLKNAEAFAVLSLNEIALLAGAAAAGAAAGSIGVYLYSRKEISRKDSNESIPPTHVNFEDIDEKKFERLIPKPQLEKTRRELRTLLLEKELVSGALTRLYEAEAAHEITKEEREILGLKYREELKALDEKIVGIDSFIELGDLETLREQLLDLVKAKIDAIEKRIERAKLSSSPLLAEITKPVPENTTEKKDTQKVPNISDLLETKPQEVNPEMQSADIRPTIEEARPTLRKKTGDAQVDNLQKELLEALDRLEKLDIET
ncbi:MAG TPA: hypothetical protein VJN71_01280 [Nitrososphaerales archaeon]|nr:hypothetical protein [Nitrososphaerales archaeon]